MLIRKTVNYITLISILIAIVIIIVYQYSWWIVFAIGGLWLLITAYGVMNIQSGYFLKSLSSNPTITSRQVALTFDDGPDQNTLKIIEILDRYKAKGTFFCIGKQVDQHPEILKLLHKKGYVIGNHTYTHSQFIDIYSTEKFILEIEDTDNTIRKYIGKTPQLFRPPYGITNPNIARAVKKTGHRVIGWNKRSFDTTIPSEKLILAKITKNLKSGDILLLHDTKMITNAVLEQLLLFLQKNNYKTVTIDELFSIQAYA